MLGVLWIYEGCGRPSDEQSARLLLDPARSEVPRRVGKRKLFKPKLVKRIRRDGNHGLCHQTLAPKSPPKPKAPVFGRAFSPQLDGAYEFFGLAF